MYDFIIKNNKNTEEDRFIWSYGNSKKNYANGLKVEEFFFRYKRIIANKFKVQYFLRQ